MFVFLPRLVPLYYYYYNNYYYYYYYLLKYIIISQHNYLSSIMFYSDMFRLNRVIIRLS
jgi:hypothetical protein